MSRSGRKKHETEKNLSAGRHDGVFTHDDSGGSLRKLSGPGTGDRTGNRGTSEGLSLIHI